MNKKKSTAKKARRDSLQPWFDRWWKNNGRRLSRDKGNKEYLCAMAFYYGVLNASRALEKLHPCGAKSTNWKAILNAIETAVNYRDESMEFFEAMGILPKDTSGHSRDV